MDLVACGQFSDWPVLIFFNSPLNGCVSQPAPENIIDFCLLHMKDPGTLHGAETAWMLEMVKLITRMFWFSSTQAQQLLERFPSGTAPAHPAAFSTRHVLQIRGSERVAVGVAD